MSAKTPLEHAIETLNYAKKLGATSADAISISSADVSTSVRHGLPEDIERSESSAIGLRIFIGQQSACVSGSDFAPESLKNMAERAFHMAKLAPEDIYAGLAPVERLARDIPALDLHDTTPAPTMQQLQEWCKETEEAATSVQGITNSEGASAGYSAHQVALVTSHGLAQEYRSTSWQLSVSVLAGQDTQMERDYDYSSTRHAEDLRSPASIGATAAARTLRRLNPRKVSTCHVPVVFEPRIARALLSSLAGAISGAAIANGTSFLKHSLGQQIFAPSIRITDNPLRVRGLASRPFDGEGVAATPITVVEKGVLNSWIMDVRSANKLGLQTTGHAMRGLASAPTPSTSNFTLEAGTMSAQDMIKSTHTGLYVTEMFGMGINLITGDFSQGAAGYWIENGELAYPVSEITIAGHLKDMFLELEAANDLEYIARVNTPTVRVANMTIAGA